MTQILTNPENNIVAAAEALSETLKSENAALESLDFKAAVMLLQQKQVHGRAFMTAQAQALANDIGSLPRARLRQLAVELGSLASDNKRLLERALTVQSRLIANLAQAVPRATAANGGMDHYTSEGRHRRERIPTAVALRARA